MTIHPQNPQPRFVQELVAQIEKSAVVVLPTDSGYSLCCKLGQKKPLERICRIRQLDEGHFFTLLCRDLSAISHYGRLDNVIFRFIKSHTPAAITFILPATKAVPKELLQEKRKTIGVRIPQNAIMLALLASLGEPLMSVSVDSVSDDYPVLDPSILYDQYQNQVDYVVDGGMLALQPTTVVDLTTNFPEIIRQGAYRID